MTREEIIQGLYRGDGRAIKEAIKVLERESCEDCVSRTEAKELAWGLCLETCYDNEKVIEMLDDLPSVTPTKCIATVKFSKEDLQEIVQMEKERVNES